MIQESDLSYTTSMYVTQNWCILDEIDLCYFQICIIMHKNNLFDKTLMYSRSKFCPQKTPIRRTVKKEQSRLSFKTATFFLDLHIVPKAFDDMI